MAHNQNVTSAELRRDFTVQILRFKADALLVRALRREGGLLGDDMFGRMGRASAKNPIDRACEIPRRCDAELGRPRNGPLAGFYELVLAAIP